MTKRILFLLFCTMVFSEARPQVADVISGETLTAEDLENYRTNPVIRARFNHDPYDNERAEKLRGNMPYVSGEILNPGQAYTDELKEHSVVVKEFTPGRRGGEPQFRGAFRYTGYSLSDIIKDYIISKNNKSEFGLNIDLYVVVENDRGESAVFSWGELFLGTHNHDIIIATHAQPVFPTASDDEWPVPRNIRLVAANDYLTVRNIDKPSKIIIRSFPVSFPGRKGIRPLFSPILEIIDHQQNLEVISGTDNINGDRVNHELIFFGLHKGLKGPRKYKGIPLADVLKKHYDFSPDEIANGMMAIGAKDAYRAVYSLSEIMNRTDMNEIILMDEPDNEDGRFIVHPGADFFADRHLKGAKQAYIMINK